MTLDRVLVKYCLIAVTLGLLSALGPGLYADWAFVRTVRQQQETQLQQQLKAAGEEIQKLKAQLGSAK